MSKREPKQFQFEKKLRQCARANPFVPYDVITSSGQGYEIRDPLQLAMGENSIVVLMPKTGIQVVRKNTIAAICIHRLG